MNNHLAEIRQVLAEMPDKTFSAKELWELFDMFQPLFTAEQEKELIKFIQK